MEKGDDAKSTKDVKEGDGFTLSYLIIHMKILLLDSSWDGDVTFLKNQTNLLLRDFTNWE